MKIEAGTNILTDNWSFQVIAEFLSNRRDPGSDSGWIAINNDGAYYGIIKSGVFQIDCLTSLLEQILFVNKISLMKDWVKSWYPLETDLNELYKKDQTGIICDFDCSDFNINEERENWLPKVLPNKQIKEKYDNGMEAYNNGRNDFWSQVINGILEYISIASLRHLTYAPHPSRYRYLKSTLWSVSNGDEYPSSGINRFNQIINNKRLCVSKKYGRDDILTKLNSWIPSAALLCIAESDQNCSPISVALQYRDNEEIKTLRDILHNLTIAIGTKDTELSTSTDEVDFYVNAFENSIAKAEHKMAIPKSLGGNNKSGYIEMEYYDYQRFNNSKIIGKTIGPCHSGILTKLINTGSVHTRKLLETKLKIKDPMVYEQLFNWHKNGFNYLLGKSDITNLYNIKMEKNKYINKKGTVGIMGPDGRIIDSNLGYNYDIKVDLGALAKELGLLLGKLKEEAKSPGHFSECVIVAEAKDAAEKGDQNKVLEALKKTGKWALDAATEIGTTVAAEVIKKSIGL